MTREVLVYLIMLLQRYNTGEIHAALHTSTREQGNEFLVAAKIKK
jgi:hypothetical protein